MLMHEQVKTRIDTQHTHTYVYPCIYLIIIGAIKRVKSFESTRGTICFRLIRVFIFRRALAFGFLKTLLGQLPSDFQSDSIICAREITRFIHLITTGFRS